MLTFRERLGLVLGLQAGCVYAVAYDGDDGRLESLTWENVQSSRLFAGATCVLMASVPIAYRPG